MRVVIQNKLEAKVLAPMRRIRPTTIAGEEIQLMVILPANRFVARQRLMACWMQLTPLKAAQVESVQAVEISFL